MTRTGIKINDYLTSKISDFTTNKSRSSLCDFSDTFIVLRGTIRSAANDVILFKNCSTFINWNTETNKSQVDKSFRTLFNSAIA